MSDSVGDVSIEPRQSADFPSSISICGEIQPEPIGSSALIAASPPAGPDGIFVYGTLLPGQVRWRFLRPWVTGDGVATTAAADLYDTGLGYPAAVFAPSPSYRGGTTRGMRFVLQPHRIVDALDELDAVEGAVEGLFHRLQIRTTDGAQAWAYSFGGGVALTPITEGDWTVAYPSDSA